MKTCAVSEFKCLAPAGWGTAGGYFINTDERLPGKTKCYICDQPVCTECSRLVTWYGKRVRGCTDCVDPAVDDFYGDLATQTGIV